MGAFHYGREMFVVHCMCEFNTEFVLVINDICI